MPNCHIVCIPFTGVGLHGGFRGNVWYKHRIEVFKNYTLKSLANQSNKDFILWLWFRPEEESNPLTLEIAHAIKAAGLPFVFTFYGLMYWDDKFNDFTLKRRLKNLVTMLWDCYFYKEWRSLREMWKYTWQNKNGTLLQRITSALVILNDSIGTDYDWVYLTRIDSDDMFHRDVVDLIQSKEPQYKKALVLKKGYIYNTQTNQTAEWNPPTNPPFHTIIFPGSVFFNQERHLEYYGSFTSHEDIPRVFDCETLDMQGYCVSYHGKHISTAWDSPLAKKVGYVIKYGTTEPFKREQRGYCYTTSGKNISTRWESRTGKIKNSMIGEEFKKKEEILKDFGI